MATFVSKDGTHTTTTTHPGERVQLLAQGYREVQGAPRPQRVATPAAPKIPADRASKTDK